MYAVYGENRVISEGGGVVPVVVAPFNERGVGAGCEYWGDGALESNRFGNSDAKKDSECIFLDEVMGVRNGIKVLVGSRYFEELVLDRSPDGFCKWAVEEYMCKILIDAKVEFREAEGAESRLLRRQAARG